MSHKEVEDNNGKAITAFILGLCGLITWLLPIVGIPVAITGIIFGFIASNRLKAVIGIFLCTLSFGAAAVNSYIGYQNGKKAQQTIENQSTDYNSYSNDYYGAQ